jgi:RNA-directed DNA polymerase
VALDGIERLFEAERPSGQPKNPAARRGCNKGIAVIRYCDDFVITAPTREVLETYARPQVEEFLRTRGLALSEAKTRIVHSTEGFNFLGVTIRRFGNQGKLLTIPQKEKVLAHVRTLRAYLDGHKQSPARQVIQDLSPVIRGWANYYRHCTAKATFNKVEYAQWQMLWTWAKRRHPKKNKGWVKARYFGPKAHWVFQEGKAVLARPDTIPITRFVKVKGRHSPYDPALRQYWQARKKAQVVRETFSKQRLILHQRQGYRCALCQVPFVAGEAIETDHIIPKSRGGTDVIANKRLVHPWCHRQRHQRDGRKG